LIRVLPVALIRKEIKSKWLKDFLYYVPYAVLAALTFPSIFYATGNEAASLVGTLVALVLAYFNRDLWWWQ
ncbi:MAG: AzlD domain-containing protein, partial [Eubacterium sp.]|nr:AzlD domain-containing protein [Eubacterium sp.]